VFNLSADGNLTVATPGAFFIYYSRRQSYTLVVQAADPAGLACSAVVSVLVLHVNKPPVLFSAQSLGVPENGPPVQAAGSVEGMLSRVPPPSKLSLLATIVFPLRHRR
jgi:hypothetical protein